MRRLILRRITAREEVAVAAGVWRNQNYTVQKSFADGLWHCEVGQEI